MFYPVIRGVEASDLWTHWFDTHCVSTWGRLYLQDFFQIAIGPAPFAFCKKLVVDIDAIHGRQSLPVAVKVKHSADEFGIHAVFSVT